MNDAADPLSSALVSTALASLPGIAVVVFDRVGRVAGSFGAEIVTADAWAGLGPLVSAALAGETVVTDLPSDDGTRMFEATFAPTRAGGPGADATGHVIGGTMLARDVTAERVREHTLAHLRHLADHDALTGLFTRRRFAEELRREAARTARHRRTGCLLMLDLDGFKDVNDRFGHRRGDDLLRELGEALRATLRAGDILGRIGGDEFAALLPDTDLMTGQVVADRLLEAVRAHGCVGTGAIAVRVTASIGLTVLDGGCGSVQAPGAVDHLLAEADEAMYRAKAAGKDAVRAWAPTGEALAQSG